MNRFVGAALIAASMAFPSLASGQATMAPRIGVMGGLNFATLGGDDADDAKMRTGAFGGVSLVKPLSAGYSLELNGLFSQKGAKNSDGVADAELKLTYIEVPVLLRYAVNTTGRVDPHFVGGVSLGYQTGCKIAATDAGFSGEVDCDILDDESTVKKFDAGVVVGAGLDFALSNTRVFTLGARYNFGLTDIFEDSSVRNRVMQIYAGFSIPMRR